MSGPGTTEVTRMLVVWCCDWPVLAVAASVPPEVRTFEPVLTTLEAFTPRMEVTRPGACAFPTRGPSRYFGGDVALAQQVRAAVTRSLDGVGQVQVGVADGRFAATLASRSIEAAEAPVVVPPGEGKDFLSGFSVRAIDRPDLVDVLERLGLTTLGAVAALSASDLLGRFGREGARVHRLASGLDEYPPHLLVPPLDLHEETEIDPPAQRVEQVALAGRALADRLHERLTQQGLACLRVGIRATSDHGETQERFWRHEGALTAGAMADRIRWQLDGWLTGPTRFRPTAGIISLRLTPDQVLAASGRQLGFWGGETESAERVTRALRRVESILGAGSVAVPEYAGGRHPGDEFRLVPVGAVDLTTARSLAPQPARVDWDDLTRPEKETPVWPGRLPRPRPAAVHPKPLPADLLDAVGETVGVDARLVLSGEPVWLSIAGGPRLALRAWAGPWPVDELWWDADRHRRQVRFQVVTAAGVAHLLALEAGTWHLDATYD